MISIHRIEHGIVWVLQRCLALVPLGIVRRFARFAGLLVFNVVRYRRTVTLINIRKAYPELSDDQHIRIASQCYQSVAVTLFEFLLFGTFDETQIRSMSRITNPEALETAFSEGKGVILLTAHYGSWEIFGQRAGLSSGHDGRLLMKIQSNRFIAEEVDRWRTRFGLRTASASAGIREVLRTLRAGGWVVIAADQAAPRESVPISFFSRPVPTYQGPASFALQTGAPILLGVAHREEDDMYEITFQRIHHEDLDGSDPEAVRILTERHVRATEDVIRKDPGQWMWMHKRWKHVDML